MSCTISGIIFGYILLSFTILKDKVKTNRVSQVSSTAADVVDAELYVDAENGVDAGWQTGLSRENAFQSLAYAIERSRAYTTKRGT
jgi:hypothetical protein